MNPLYRGINTPSTPGHGHKGLWFDRFFNEYQQDWKLDDSAKLNWISTVAGPAGERTQVEAAAKRLRGLCLALDGQCFACAAPWHFATGLGNPHPVENGSLWHPTLGTPFIPGPAVKGIVRTWVEVWMDFAIEDERAATLHRWFGSENKNPKVPHTHEPEAGCFIFFDALPLTPVTMKADVMTPHMGKWYAEGGGITSIASQPDLVPADWHDPVPVPFLVADKPSFQFCIAPRRGSAIGELGGVAAALKRALEWLGAGAKTAVGYGRFGPDPSENARLESERQNFALSQLSEEERIREQVKNLTEKKLAECLGRNKNKTMVQMGNDWAFFLATVQELRGKLIRSWKNSGSENEKKAYKTMFND